MNIEDTNASHYNWIMDKTLTDRLRQRQNSFRTKHYLGLKEPFKLTVDEFIRFVTQNGIVDDVLAYSGLSGFSRIDPNKPWAIGNLHYTRPKPKTDEEIIAQNERYEKRQARIKQEEQAVPLTKAQWIAELRAAKTSQPHK